MRTLLTDAQILADTFSGRWKDGISASEIRAALDELKGIPERPLYLIDRGIPEPVAVASSVFEDTEGINRLAYIVIDSGAGTTDFGLFVHSRLLGENNPRTFQISGSTHGLMQAGDKVDEMLLSYILLQEDIVPVAGDPNLNVIDLKRTIRTIKESVFSKGEYTYRLVEGTMGTVTRDNFISSQSVIRFQERLIEGMRDVFKGIHISWIKWLSQEGRTIGIVLTGGSSRLPMLAKLGEIEIIKIERNNETYVLRFQKLNSRPDWIERTAKEFQDAYPQLAVAIGAAAENVPGEAPPVAQFHAA